MHATEKPVPPSPPDPITERANERWDLFQSESEEGRIAVFHATLEDAEIMTDDLAYGMLERIHSDAKEHGDRTRYSECVTALRERLPDVYDQSACCYVSNCLFYALAENRVEAVASLTRELATMAGKHMEMFDHAAEGVAYHGHLSALVDAYRIAAPAVNSDGNLFEWAVTEFGNTGAEYEMLNYLEQGGSADPIESILFERLKPMVADLREDRVLEYIRAVSGNSGKEWRTDEFILRKPRKRVRREWDDDEEIRDARDPAATSLSCLVDEFVGIMCRDEDVSFTRGRLAGRALYSYFIERHHGKLDPHPSMLDPALRPDVRPDKPPKPVHPLCPERVTLEVFLAGKLQILRYQPYTVAAVFQAVPAWLRFLQSRRLIDAGVRRNVVDDLAPLHQVLSKLWRSFKDDPALERDGEPWAADAAKGPIAQAASNVCL